MGDGKTENVAKASDYQFADPTGQFQGGLDNFLRMGQFGQQGMVGALDPNNAFNAFMGQAPGLTNLAMGPNAQLTEQLNSIASRQANEGIANAGTQFAANNAFNSGAANRAMGLAGAQPFADVAAQQQQNQLNLTGNLWNQAFGGAQGLQNTAAGLYGNIYGQGMGNYGNMASQTGGMMAPQYQYKPGFWDNAMSAGGLGLQAAGLFF